MKTVRFGAIAIMAFMLLYVSGCYDSAYYFNFAVEGDLVNEDGAWLTDTGLYGVGKDGLFLDDSWITAPLEFAGDFSVKANFWFQAVSLLLGNIKICISDRPWREDPANFARFFILDMGSASEILRAEEGGTGSYIYYLAPFNFTSLRRSGWNEMLMQKTGNHLKLLINGRLIYGFDMVHCESDYYAINFRFDTEGDEDPENPAFGGILKDVKIQYEKGNAQLITFP